MLTAKQYRDAADLLLNVSRTQDHDTRAALLDLVAQFLRIAERLEREAAEAPKKPPGDAPCL